MNFKGFIGKYGAYLLAAVLFVAAALVYCSPVLGGKKLYAGDIQNYLGASQESRDYHNETGEYTFWNGAMFSGMPNYQIGGGHYASDSLLKPLSKVLSHRDNPVLMLLLYLVCFFIMMRSFRVNKWLSIAGAFAVTLSSYFLVIIPAGHFTKITSIALCGLVLGGFRLVFDRKYLTGAVLTLIGVALAFKPHPQMFYYFTLMMGVMWIAEAVVHIKARRFKELGLATLIFVLASAIGIGTGSANIFANSEYAAETMRGRHSDLVKPASEDSASSTADSQKGLDSKGLDIEYATQWSYGIDETFSFLIPAFKGGANSIDVGKDSKLYRELVKVGVGPRDAADFCKGAPMYWGDQPFTAGNVYVGAIVCLLFVLGLMIVKGPRKWALLAATVFSVALSWGHNCMWLTQFFFDHFPMYNKFRAVSSVLVVAEVAMPLLGFLALKELWEKRSDAMSLKQLWTAAGITGGICLFFALFGGVFFDFSSAYDAQQLPDWAIGMIQDQRASLLRSDCFRSLIFIALATGAIFIWIKGKLKDSWFVAALTLLVLCDMWPVDKRYFNDSNFIPARQSGTKAFAMQPYEEQILQDKGYFRVFNLTASPFNDSRTSYRLKSIGGYSAAKLRRYNDLIDEHLSKMHLPVIGMLNAKYIITPGEGGQPEVQLNPYALGNAWFVGRLVTVDTPNEESDALNTIELEHEAVLDKSFASFLPDYEPAVPEDAVVTLVSHTPNDLEYEYSTSAPGTLVFSEIYYPYGWKATLDGAPVDHYRVDWLLRAVNVPAGSHSIHFTFDPDSVRKGNGLSIACIILMYLLILTAIGYGTYNCIKNKKTEKI